MKIGKYSVLKKDLEPILDAYYAIVQTQERQKTIRENVYRHNTAVEDIEDESQLIYWVEDIIFDKGVYQYIRGMEYPSRNFAPQDMLASLNIVKRMIIESFRVITYLPLIIRPTKFITKVLQSFNEVAYKKVLHEFLWQPEMMTPVSQEIRIFITRFLIKLNIPLETSIHTADVISHFVNGDNAYRWRLQDLFNESSKDKLRKPRKELKRLLQINSDREVFGRGVWEKFKTVYTVLSLILLIPKVKRAWNYALDVVEYNKLIPDKIDKFEMCCIPEKSSSYNYLGKTAKERRMMINHLRVAKPSKKPQCS
jgi:hypothetical protein